MLKQIWIICLGLVLFIACKDDKTEEVGQQVQENFLRQTEFGAYTQGNTGFLYQAGLYQLVFTTDGLKCRIQTDDLSKYVAFELTEKPVAGQMIKVKIAVKAVEGISSGEQLYQVLKNEGGKCWLWESASSVGYLLKTGE